MAHAPAGRRGLAGDERRHRLGHVRFDELRGRLLRRAANFANQQHRLGLRVGFEKPQQIDLIGTDDRVAADAHGGGLAQAEARKLPDGFVGQGAAARDQANRAGLVNVTRHDADLALARRDDAGAVRPDQARLRFLPKKAHHAGHVQHRNPFGDADDQRDFRIDRLADRVRRPRRRHIDHRRIGAGLFARFLHRIEHRQAEMRGVMPPTICVPYSRHWME